MIIITNVLTFLIVFFITFSSLNIIFLLVDNKIGLFKIIYEKSKKARMINKVKIFIFVIGITTTIFFEVNIYSLGILSGVMNGLHEIIFENNGN